MDLSKIKWPLAIMVSCALNLTGCGDNQQHNNRPSPKAYEINEYIIDDDIQLSKDTLIEANKIVFTDSIKVNISKYNLELNANEIVFKDTDIVSFLTSSRASKRKHGFHSGSVKIDTIDIKGQVSFSLNGQAAGHGQNGRCVRPNPFGTSIHIAVKQPTNGMNGGDSGSLFLNSYSHSKDFRLSLESFAGNKGNAGKIKSCTGAKKAKHGKSGDPKASTFNIESLGIDYELLDLNLVPLTSFNYPLGSNLEEGL